jgi:tRNA modification GTPase
MKVKLPYDNDTIAAIATAQGEGGIAVIRISGPQVPDIINNIFHGDAGTNSSKRDSHHLYHGSIKDPDTGAVVDEVLCTLMKAPNSYTGENVAEIHSHGGYLVPKKILELLYKHGARPADPGEFSLRAFLNGKMDLAQAEAVSDVINAQTEEGLKQSEMQLEGVLSQRIASFKDVVLDLLAEIESQVDFPEEDIDPLVKKDLISRTESLITDILSLLATYEEGRIIKYGVITTILGKPNVGKSSLLNSLLMRERAIVSHQPGTTRDFIEESIDIRGIPLKLIDTAGIRTATDHIEKTGIELAKKKAREGELLIAVIDGSTDLDQDDKEVLSEINDKNAVLVVNKSDLGLTVSDKELELYIQRDRIARTSAKKSTGIEELKDIIRNSLINRENYSKDGEIILTELRHKSALENSVESLRAFLNTFQSGESPEFSALDLRDALNSLGEITGEVTTEDVLGRIFSKFCVGK